MTGQPTKILIVDDRRENILALASLIQAPDIEIVSAISGDQALELLLKHEVALALLDVEMPEMDGLELARIMRSAERTKSVPIIFVTASTRGTASRFEGYERGAIAYLTKPLDTHLVRNKVRVFVDLDQRTKALKQQTIVLEEKLRENEILRREAENATIAKSRFIANISHEIRTPLGAVLGFAELLKVEGQTGEEVTECIEAIERNGNLLARLIDDVIDLTKIEAERVEVEDLTVSLAEIIKDIQAIHSLRAREKGIAFDVELPGEFPKFIRTDPMRLKQCISNIVGNAVKFTHKGSVTLICEANRKGDQCFLRFAVRDTGCGLSLDEAERLFQPFTQADSSTTRRYGGSGLGLVISRGLARLLGGDLVLSNSKSGEGSIFTLTAQVAIDPVMDASVAGDLLLLDEVKGGYDANSNELEGIRVLVVDDAEDNRTLLLKSLVSVGARVELAENGYEALAKVKDNDFEVILLDLQMPLMDGYQAARSMRSFGYQGRIYALTAHATRELYGQSKAAGCDLFLSKPVKRSKLIEVVKMARSVPTAGT